MFDKIQQGKDLLKMRSEAKKLQKSLSEVTESEESGDIKVKVSADQKVQFIEINGEAQEELVRTINKAFEKVQKKAAQKMMEEGGGLSGLLGNFK